MNWMNCKMAGSRREEAKALGRCEVSRRDGGDQDWEIMGRVGRWCGQLLGMAMALNLGGGVVVSFAQDLTRSDHLPDARRHRFLARPIRRSSLRGGFCRLCAALGFASAVAPGWGTGALARLVRGLGMGNFAGNPFRREPWDVPPPEFQSRHGRGWRACGGWRCG